MSKFEAYYEVDDGYVGGSRPIYFDIDEEDIAEDMDEEQLAELFDEAMYWHFQNNIQPYSNDKEKFIEWAKEIIKKRKEDDV